MPVFQSRNVMLKIKISTLYVRWGRGQNVLMHICSLAQLPHTYANTQTHKHTHTNNDKKHTHVVEQLQFSVCHRVWSLGLKVDWCCHDSTPTQIRTWFSSGVWWVQLNFSGNSAKNNRTLVYWLTFKNTHTHRHTHKHTHARTHTHLHARTHTAGQTWKHPSEVLCFTIEGKALLSLICVSSICNQKLHCSTRPSALAFHANLPQVRS